MDGGIHNWKRRESLKEFYCAPLTGTEWKGIDCGGDCGARISDKQLCKYEDFIGERGEKLRIVLDVLAW